MEYINYFLQDRQTWGLLFLFVGIVIVSRTLISEGKRNQ